MNHRVLFEFLVAVENLSNLPLPRLEVILQILNEASPPAKAREGVVFAYPLSVSFIEQIIAKKRAQG